eukprot:g4071.t1
MEESKLVALHEELSRHGPGRSGLSSRNDIKIPKEMRRIAARNAAADAKEEFVGDDLKTRRKRALYKNFVREGERHKTFSATQRTRMVFHDDDITTADANMCPGRCGRCAVCKGAAACNEKKLAKHNRAKKKELRKKDRKKALKEEKKIMKNAEKAQSLAKMTKSQKAERMKAKEAKRAAKRAAKKAAKLEAKKAAKLEAKKNAKIEAKRAEKRKRKTNSLSSSTEEKKSKKAKKMKKAKKGNKGKN